MTQFEDKFMEVQASMVSLAMEYVQNQAEKIYIYCILVVIIEIIRRKKW